MQIWAKVRFLPNELALRHLILQREQQPREKQDLSSHGRQMAAMCIACNTEMICG